MKTLKLLSFLAFFISLATFSLAQELKTETIRVSGNCGMCKSRIEKAAKAAGAESADWSAETKLLKLTFNSVSTDAAKIQQAIAAVGHDTRDVKAPDAVYDKLPSCCKYERGKTDDITSMHMPSPEKMEGAGEKQCGMDCCKHEKESMHKEAHADHEDHQGMMMNCTMMQKTKKVS